MTSFSYMGRLILFVIDSVFDPESSKVSYLASWIRAGIDDD